MKLSKYIVIFLSFLGCLQGLFPQEMLSKEEVVRLALENNYDVKVAVNQAKIAEHNASFLNSGFLPSIVFETGATYDNNSQEVSRSNGEKESVRGAEAKSLSANLTLRYLLFDGYGRKFNYKRLKETHELIGLQAKEVIENMYLSLFNLYFEVAQATELKQNLKENLDISKQRLQRSQLSYEYGQANKLAISNAQVDVNNDSINYANSVQYLKNVKRQLLLVLGATHLNENFLVDTQVTFGELKPITFFENLAKHNNVSLRQLDKKINISKLDLKVNKSSFLPKATFNSSYAWRKNENPSTSFLQESTIEGLSMGIALSWNLFDGGITKTRVSNAKIDIENQHLLKEQKQKELGVSLKNTYESFINALWEVEAGESNVLISQENYNRSEEQFKLGQISSIEYRQAQLNILYAKNSLSQARYSAKLIELQLYALSGSLLDYPI